jgi:hypothetical protein
MGLVGRFGWFCRPFYEVLFARLDHSRTKNGISGFIGRRAPARRSFSPNATFEELAMGASQLGS